jgi:L,D-peptidoglycan transpeptidase YkuD (ErfK/YbiS/YcfS/YnhG family)
MTDMDWKSHEEMHRKDEDYKWGIFVQHNDHPVKKSMGSCIFLHIWEGADEGTAGCTAMEEKNMLELLHWARAEKHPLLVQFPEIVYQKMHTDYQLPDL